MTTKEKLAEIRAHHLRLMQQVEALLAHDFEAYKKLVSWDERVGTPVPPSCTSAFDAWGRGANLDCLFGNVNGCSCLTQLKDIVQDGAPSNDEKKLYDRLGLGNEPLIPRTVHEDWQPTRAQLEVFAGLQLIALWGEENCRRARVIVDF